MDILKTPSVQSLLDSDLESVDSFPYLDVEELDEVEYALPVSEAPTLAEVLSADDDTNESTTKINNEPQTCSALQADFLQAVSQQLLQAQERSSAGAATTIGVGKNGKLTVGTAHGHLLSFQDQSLRWVCDSHADKGAVSSLAFNHDSTRLLAGYARGYICQYESTRGVVLRRVTLGCEIWGILKVTWAGTIGLALDTGGSVWLIKFSRPLGVRSARASCLFSGARGEVVTLAARDARILAMATLTRVIVVAGGRAAGVRLGGPPDILPVIEWCENDEKVLICARARILQWLSVNITGTSVSLYPLQRVELKSSPLWLGWLGGNLAIFDINENLRLMEDDTDNSLDLSYVEPVYASAFFKGLWTDGRVSRAMGTAGASALGGVCVVDGVLSLLGRKGVVRIKPRDVLARAQAFITSGRHLQALKLLCSTKSPEAHNLAVKFISHLSERPHALSDKLIADYCVKLCVKFKLSEDLWSTLWENCCNEKSFVEAIGDATVRGELSNLAPSPDSSQALIEKLEEFEPDLVERVVSSLPLTSLDPHRASIFTREKRLWRAVGAIAASLGGGPSGAMRSLVQYVDAMCGSRRRAGGTCSCAGAALVVAAADALAGRHVPAHAQHAARHDALLTLLADDAGAGGKSPLRVLVEHEAAAAARLLEQSARDPPFAGPLGKQNRLRVARALLSFAPTLPDADDRIEVLEFITGQLSSGALPADPDVISNLQEVAECSEGERADRAWLILLTRARSSNAQLEAALERAHSRPRVLWRINALLNRHQDALKHFFLINDPSTKDIEELFDYLKTTVESDEASAIEPYLPRLLELHPTATASIMDARFQDSIPAILKSHPGEPALKFAECLLDRGILREEGALAHFRNLCVLMPTSCTEFLVKNPGTIRPEDALDIVKELKVAEAEPMCLEATGDLDGALDVVLKLAAAADDSNDKERAVRLVNEACALCSRASASVPPASAAAMWTRLVRSARHAPPTLLLDAANYLPVQELMSSMCASSSTALWMLRSVCAWRRQWQCAARECGRDAHFALARALRSHRHATPVRAAACPHCTLHLLQANAIRTAHCGRAFHTHCEMEVRCGVCGQHVSQQTVAVQCTRATRHAALAGVPQQHSLNLAAPPRPDLEGVA